jgi:hypothetical protein
MRNGQSKRMRGRNRKSHNPLTRVYESNGPDVKIRGTANHIAEKYIQLARDAQASGDPVAAENYYQHAEHYFRLIAAAQEQFRQSQPFYRPEGGGEQPRGGEENFDDGEDEVQPYSGGAEPYYPRDTRGPQQPYPPREQRDQQQPREHTQQHRPRPDQRPQEPRGQGGSENGDYDRLPSFITGGAQPAPAAPSYGQNGYDGQPDRFPLHRRRRRGHRGPRPDIQGSPQGVSEGADEGAQPSGPAPAGE